ncbi:hypothetical protein CDAR_372611 [Caerostris darwini]|uniref:Uncharacterized protein n=1 Tax=Caerostris darwini TaxID=1538125 RepID=A0AAV4TAP7_9ARAC|nr:hypothetical protein CDAR_372611 [Caerostris darwini]
MVVPMYHIPYPMLVSSDEKKSPTPSWLFQCTIFHILGVVGREKKSPSPSWLFQCTIFHILGVVGREKKSPSPSWLFQCTVFHILGVVGQERFANRFATHAEYHPEGSVRGQAKTRTGPNRIPLPNQEERSRKL